MHGLDSATLHRLTRLNSFVDTSKMHENLNRQFIWVQTDTGNKTVYYQDTVWRAALSRRSDLNPIMVKEYHLRPITIDSLAKDFKFSTTQVILNHLRVNPQTFEPQNLQSRLQLTDLLKDSIHRVSVISPVTVKKEKVSIQVSAPPAMRQVNRTQSKAASVRLPVSTLNPADQKKKVQAKTNQLTEVVQKMAVEYVRKSLPLEKRLPRTHLDTLVKNELIQAGINLPFEYAVVQDKQRVKVPIQTSHFRPKAKLTHTR